TTTQAWSGQRSQRKHRWPKARRRSWSTSSTTAAAWARAAPLRSGANGKPPANERIERTMPIQFSIGEGLDVGMDNGSAVDWTYTLPFKFSGRIDQVAIEVFPEKQ